jgi:hypothetical protein
MRVLDGALRQYSSELLSLKRREGRGSDHLASGICRAIRHAT